MIDVKRFLIDPSKVVVNILQQPKSRGKHIHNLFNTTQHIATNQGDRLAFERMSKHGGLSLLGDFDKDGALNVLDCNPMDASKQDFLYETGRLVGKGMVLGKKAGKAVGRGAVALGRTTKHAIAVSRGDIKEEMKLRREHQLKLAKEKRRERFARLPRGRRQPRYLMIPTKEKTMFGLRPTSEMFARPRSEGLGLMSAMPKQEDNGIKRMTKIGTAGGFEMMMGGKSSGSGFGEMSKLHGMSNGSKGSLLMGGAGSGMGFSEMMSHKTSNSNKADLLLGKKKKELI